MTDDQRLEILSRVHGRLHGFGGDCGVFAVALNRVLFGGRGQIVAALNRAAWRQHGRAIGHVGVRFDGAIWDADGAYDLPDDLDEFLDWGRLDDEDPDYAFLAGDELDEAESVELSDDEALQRFAASVSLTRAIAVLEDARNAVMREDGEVNGAIWTGPNVTAALREELARLIHEVELSEDDKAIDMALNDAHFLSDWLETADPDDAEALRETIGENFADLLEDDPNRIVDEMSRDLQIEYGQYVIDHHIREVVDTAFAPLWVYFYSPKEEPNQWLLHFTDDAQNIAENGFEYGVTDTRMLGLSTWWKKEAKSEPGYTFAFTVENARRHARSRGGFKYGDEAVLFRAPGVTMWHIGDEEPQTIVWGPDAKDRIALTSYDGQWRVGDMQEPTFDDLFEAVEWVEKNYSKQKRKIGVHGATENPVTTALLAYAVSDECFDWWVSKTPPHRRDGAARGRFLRQVDQFRSALRDAVVSSDEIRIWRAMTTPGAVYDVAGFEKHVAQNRIGTSWAWKHEGAFAYEGGGQYMLFVLEATAPVSSIDIEATVQHFLGGWSDEIEIRLRKGAPLTLHAVLPTAEEYEDGASALIEFDPPRRVTASVTSDTDDLGLVSVTENGIRFETGVPVRFRFIRNTERSGYYGARFQQDIEPAGRYMNLSYDDSQPPPGWEAGEVEFRKPLVLAFNAVTGVSYDEHSWKARLARHYGAAGRTLTAALRRDGYDGIVTVMLRGGSPAYTSEIVDLIGKNANTTATAARSPIEAAARRLMYHGTSSVFLRSILKNGLIPRPGQRVWDGDKDISFHTSSRESYHGVYLAERFVTASSASVNSIKKFGGNQLIIAAQIQPSTALADEDSIRYVVDRAVSRALRDAWNAVLVDSTAVLAWSAMRVARDLDPAGSDYLDGNARVEWKNLCRAYRAAAEADPALKSRNPKIGPALLHMFESALTRLAAHASTDRYEWRRLLDRSYVAVDTPQPSVSAGEAQYRAALDALTRILRRVDFQEFNPTLRIDSPIGFSGANRIICVAEKLGKENTVVVHYGTVPPDMKHSIHESWGAVEIVRAIDKDTNTTATAARSLKKDEEERNMPNSIRGESRPIWTESAQALISNIHKRKPSRRT